MYTTLPAPENKISNCVSCHVVSSLITSNHGEELSYFYSDSVLNIKKLKDTLVSITFRLLSL